jgi:hypothetical protein
MRGVVLALDRAVDAALSASSAALRGVRGAPARRGAVLGSPPLPGGSMAKKSIDDLRARESALKKKLSGDKAAEPKRRRAVSKRLRRTQRRRRNIAAAAKAREAKAAQPAAS